MKIIFTILLLVCTAVTLVPARVCADTCTTEDCGGVGCPLPSGIAFTVLQAANTIRTKLKQFQKMFGQSTEDINTATAAAISGLNGAQQAATGMTTASDASVADAASGLDEAQQTGAAAEEAMRTATVSEAVANDAATVGSAAPAALSIGQTSAAHAEINRSHASGGEGATSTENLARRFQTFRERYCNPANSNGALENPRVGCPDNTEGDNVRFNRDIRYDLTVDQPLTLTREGADKDDVDFLGSYLYASEIPNPVRAECLSSGSIGDGCNQTILRWRRFMALLGLANNTYTSIVATKTAPEGAADAEAVAKLKEYMEEAFGDTLTPERAYTLDPDGASPSYFAQSEAITRFRQLSPEHLARTFTVTGENQEDLERQRISQDAIGLYQAFEHLETLHGWETKLATLVDLRIERKFPSILQAAGGADDGH